MKLTIGPIKKFVVLVLKAPTEFNEKKKDSWKIRQAKIRLRLCRDRGLTQDQTER